MDKVDHKSDRREFLKIGATVGSFVLLGVAISKALSLDLAKKGGGKAKVLTTDGKVMEVDAGNMKHPADVKFTNQEMRKGITGKKFVMVIDLARCANARKCVEGCQKMHHKEPPSEWIKVKLMQDSVEVKPYWMPQPCYHCDNPPCTKVCPVDATFKREDGLVLVDNDRCIGCRFCMAACPYSARSFNWAEPIIPTEFANESYSIEKSFPAKLGTVEKCDFCPDMAREGNLPDCVTACPNGTIFFGDQNEDTVTNGDETFRLSELLTQRAAYRYMEELGTEPRVYYLPPVNRNFPFEKDTVVHNPDDYKII